MGGVSLFSITTDDFKGNCKNGKYPLLTALNEILNSDALETKLPLAAEVTETTSVWTEKPS